MTPTIRLLALAAATAVAPIAAQAATITATGDVSDGIADASVRTDVDNAFDGTVSTFYALGVGGELTVDLSPSFIASPVTAIEFTYAGTYFPESAEVYLGAALAGEVFNDGSSTSTANFNILSSIAGNTTTFTLEILSGFYSSVTLRDTTMVNFAGAYGPNKVSDGFDVAELVVTAVPVPAAGFLLVGGLGALAATRRRKKS